MHIHVHISNINDFIFMPNHNLCRYLFLWMISVSFFYTFSIRLIARIVFHTNVTYWSWTELPGFIFLHTFGFLRHVGLGCNRYDVVVTTYYVSSHHNMNLLDYSQSTMCFLMLSSKVYWDFHFKFMKEENRCMWVGFSHSLFLVKSVFMEYNWNLCKYFVLHLLWYF